MSDEEGVVRALDWDGYWELVEGVNQLDEEFGFVFGTVASTRDWDDLEEEAGFTGEEPWAFLDEATQFARAGDRKQYGDYAYPAYGFADDTTEDDLDRAGKELAGLHAFPASVLNMHHPQVHTVEDTLVTIQELEAEYGDDHVLLTGAFSPEGNYQITDCGGFHRVSETWFPSRVFQSSGIAGVQKAKQSFAGTLIMHRDDLASDLLALVNGERDSIGPDEMEADA